MLGDDFNPEDVEKILKEVAEKEEKINAEGKEPKVYTLCSDNEVLQTASNIIAKNGTCARLQSSSGDIKNLTLIDDRELAMIQMMRTLY